MGVIKVIAAIIGIFVFGMILIDTVNNIRRLNDDRETSVKGLKVDAYYFVIALIIGVFIFFRLNDSLYVFG